MKMIKFSRYVVLGAALAVVTVDTTETGESLKNGKKIAPIIIWFDKKFIK